LWEDVEGHLHIFKSVKGCVEIIFFDVDGHVFGIVGADDAVPDEFGSSYIRGSCGEFTRIFDEVTSCSDAYPIWVCFLGSVIYDDSGVCYYTILGDVGDLFMGEDEHCVSAWGVSELVTLGEITEFFSKCGRP
jgi:hypothetical protein